MGQSGVDQLTRTLNEYLGALVEGILGSDGDILKFAGNIVDTADLFEVDSLSN